MYSYETQKMDQIKFIYSRFAQQETLGETAILKI